MDNIIRRAPLLIIIALVAFMIYPLAQRQNATFVGENVSPDGAYKVLIYRNANPFVEDPEAGSGWVELHDAGGDIWDVYDLDEIKNVPITWMVDKVTFGPEANFPLPSPEELAKQAREKAARAAKAAEEAAAEAEALAQQKAEQDARAKARAEYEAAQAAGQK